jgi:hypothetical protein
MGILQVDLASVQTPAPDGGARLLWQGDEYRVIETRVCAKPDAADWHADYCGGEPWDHCTQPDHPKRFAVLVERVVRTDVFGVPQWAECDGLPAEAIRQILRALALDGRAG